MCGSVGLLILANYELVSVRRIAFLIHFGPLVSLDCCIPIEPAITCIRNMRAISIQTRKSFLYRYGIPVNWGCINSKILPFTHPNAVPYDCVYEPRLPIRKRGLLLCFVFHNARPSYLNVERSVRLRVFFNAWDILFMTALASFLVTKYHIGLFDCMKNYCIHVDLHVVGVGRSTP